MVKLVVTNRANDVMLLYPLEIVQLPQFDFLLPVLTMNVVMLLYSQSFHFPMSLFLPN